MVLTMSLGDESWVSFYGGYVRVTFWSAGLSPRNAPVLQTCT